MMACCCLCCSGVASRKALAEYRLLLKPCVTAPTSWVSYEDTDSRCKRCIMFNTYSRHFFISVCWGFIAKILERKMKRREKITSESKFVTETAAFAHVVVPFAAKIFSLTSSTWNSCFLLEWSHLFLNHFWPLRKNWPCFSSRLASFSFGL